MQSWIYNVAVGLLMTLWWGLMILGIFAMKRWFFTHILPIPHKDSSSDIAGRHDSSDMGYETKNVIPAKMNSQHLRKWNELSRRN